MIRMHNNILQGKVNTITVQLPCAIPSNLHDCYPQAVPREFDKGLEIETEVIFCMENLYIIYATHNYVFIS